MFCFCINIEAVGGVSLFKAVFVVVFCFVYLFTGMTWVSSPRVIIMPSSFLGFQPHGLDHTLY